MKLLNEDQLEQIIGGFSVGRNRSLTYKNGVQNGLIIGRPPIRRCCCYYDVVLE